MVSADFGQPIAAPLDATSTRQADRSPRVRRVTFTLMPTASTSVLSGQVLGFRDSGLLTQHDRLVCDSCSSGQCFAFSFLQAPPRDGSPCRSASSSPCRVCRGLAPPSHPATTTVTETAPVKALRAMPGAPPRNPVRLRRPGCEGVGAIASPALTSQRNAPTW